MRKRLEPKILERETRCPEEKLLRNIFDVKHITKPINELQFRCICGKYRSKKYKYGDLICDSCRTMVKKRLIRIIPDTWTTEEYKNWLIK